MRRGITVSCDAPAAPHANGGPLEDSDGGGLPRHDESRARGPCTEYRVRFHVASYVQPSAEGSEEGSLAGILETDEEEGDVLLVVVHHEVHKLVKRDRRVRAGSSGRSIRQR